MPYLIVGSHRDVAGERNSAGRGLLYHGLGAPSGPQESKGSEALP